MRDWACDGHRVHVVERIVAVDDDFASHVDTFALGQDCHTPDCIGFDVGDVTLWVSPLVEVHARSIWGG